MIKVPIDIEDAVIYEDTVWFFAMQFNGLFSLNMKSRKLNSWGMVPWEPYNGVRLYVSMKLVDRKIYMIPFTASAIAVFDIKKEEFSKIELRRRLINKKERFSAVERYDKYLFVFGVFDPFILQINTVTNEIRYIDEWYEQVKNVIFDKNDAFFKKQALVLKDKIYVPFCNANAILELDCISLHTEIHIIGNEKNGFSGICYDGTRFWCSPRNSEGMVISWNNQNGIINKYTIHSHDCFEKTFYTGIICVDNKLKIFASNSRKRSIESLDEKIEIFNGRYRTLYELNNYVIYFDGLSNLLRIERKDKDIFSSFKIEVNYQDTFFDQNIKENVVVEENGKSIAQLLFSLLSESPVAENKGDDRSGEFNGEKIYSILKYSIK